MDLRTVLEKEQGNKGEKLIQALQFERLKVMTLFVTPRRGGFWKQVLVKWL